MIPEQGCKISLNGRQKEFSCKSGNKNAEKKTSKTFNTEVLNLRSDNIITMTTKTEDRQSLV